jgi:5-methylcytosine-specific restriction endonuclease McrA
MLKRDPNCTWVCREVDSSEVRRLWRFHSADDYTEEEMKDDLYRRLLALQLHAPIMVMIGKAGKRWWMFRNEFYCEDENYSDVEMKALILDSIKHKETKVQRAIARVRLEGEPSGARQPIPDEVRVLVWQRDGGCCVKCGSQEGLEFDHIIPLSQGGSNTARNLQILCEKCNRSKGANLV